MLGIVCVGLGGFAIYSIVDATTGISENHAEPAPAKDPDAYPENGWRMLHDFLYYVTVLYFALNLFYHLINTRKRIFSYFRVVVVFFLAICLYKTFLFYVFPLALHNRYDSTFPYIRHHP